MKNTALLLALAVVAGTKPQLPAVSFCELAERLRLYELLLVGRLQDWNGTGYGPLGKRLQFRVLEARSLAAIPGEAPTEPPP